MKKGAEVIDNSMMKEIGLGGNNKLVENEIEILKSYDLMKAAVNSLQLFTSVQHVGRIRDVDVFGNDTPFKFYIQNTDAIHDAVRWNVTDTVNGISFAADKGKAPVSIKYGQLFTADPV
jgi:hypothetical protein